MFAPQVPRSRSAIGTLALRQRRWPRSAAQMSCLSDRRRSEHSRSGSRTVSARPSKHLDGSTFWSRITACGPWQDVPIERNVGRAMALDAVDQSRWSVWPGEARSRADEVAAAHEAAAGHIVLISSTSGQRGEAFHCDYSATKGALISMVKGPVDRAGVRRHLRELRCSGLGRYRHERRGPGRSEERRRNSRARSRWAVWAGPKRLPLRCCFCAPSTPVSSPEKSST